MAGTDISADDVRDLAALLAAPPAISIPARLWEGVCAPLWGLRFLWRRPALWRYAIWPVLLNLLITVVVFAALIAAVGGATWLLHQYVTAGLVGSWWWVGLIAEIAAAVLLLIVCGFAAVVIWKLLSSVLCGSFYGKLAGEVERRLGIDAGELVEIPLTGELVDACIDLALLVAINAGCLLIGFVPLVGSAAGLALSVALSGFVLGTGMFGYPLGVRGRRRAEQFRYARDHLPETVGLGAMVMIVELIPVVGAVLTMTAVIGAVLLHRRLLSRDET